MGGQAATADSNMHVCNYAPFSGRLESMYVAAPPSISQWSGNGLLGRYSCCALILLNWQTTRRTTPASEDTSVLKQYLSSRL